MKNGFVRNSKVVYRQAGSVWKISRQGGPYKDWADAKGKLKISEPSLRSHLAMAFPKLDVCRYRGENKPPVGQLPLPVVEESK
jgi:hypothetical protein